MEQVESCNLEVYLHPERQKRLYLSRMIGSVTVLEY